jgi:aminopeptidase C
VEEDCLPTWHQSLQLLIQEKGRMFVQELLDVLQEAVDARQTPNLAQAVEEDGGSWNQMMYHLELY